MPEILNANSSPHLQLELTVKPGVLGLGRRLDVQASCARHHIPISDPFVGCPQCNADRPGLDVFKQALETLDDDE